MLRKLLAEINSFITKQEAICRKTWSRNGVNAIMKSHLNIYPPWIFIMFHVILLTISHEVNISNVENILKGSLYVFNSITFSENTNYGPESLLEV